MKSVLVNLSILLLFITAGWSISIWVQQYLIYARKREQQVTIQDIQRNVGEAEYRLKSKQIRSQFKWIGILFMLAIISFLAAATIK
jgi:hypothetical protein